HCGACHSRPLRRRTPRTIKKIPAATFTKAEKVPVRRKIGTAPRSCRLPRTSNPSPSSATIRPTMTPIITPSRLTRQAHRGQQNCSSNQEQEVQPWWARRLPVSSYVAGVTRLHRCSLGDQQRRGKVSPRKDRQGLLSRPAS